MCPTISNMAKRRANGEGCIRKRTDGRWEGRMTLGYSIRTGKPVQKSVYGKSQAEAKAKLARAMSEYKGAPIGHTDKYTVADWLRVWFETYSEPFLRIGTAESYRNMIENHIIPALGRIKLSSLNSIQIQRFYLEEQKSGRRKVTKKDGPTELSNAFMRSMHNTLHLALDKAVSLRLITYNPTNECRAPAIQRQEMKTLPAEFVGAYLEEAEHRGLLAIFYLELTSGLRRGELCALLLSDLNVETRVLTINKSVLHHKGKIIIQPPKTKNSFRKVVLPQITVDLILQHHEKFGDNPIMFPHWETGEYIQPNYLYRVHCKMLEAIGAEHIRFHDLRHTFSTMAIQNGVDIKTLSGMLGHFSSSFTLDTYTHITQKMQEDAAQKVGTFIEASRAASNVVLDKPAMLEEQE